LRIDHGARGGQRPRRWPWVVAAVCLAAGTGAAALWSMAGRTAAVRTVAVEAETGGARAATVLNASGYVTARRRATVSSKIVGRLIEVAVEEGLPVTAGQVLARIDDAQHRATLGLAESRLDAALREIEETQAQLELARRTLDRTRRLAASGVVDAQRLDEHQAETETLEARLAVERQQVIVSEREVALRRAELDDTAIRAPFDGIVISKDAQAGEMVSPNSAGGGFTRTGICTLVDMDSLEIEVDVNESYISRVRPGQGVEAVLDAYPDWPIGGKVITTIPAADRQKATVLVRIAFDALDPRILPDMGVKVAFREDPAADGGPASVSRRMLVPREAIRSDGGRDVVYLVIDGRAARRAVEVAGASGERLVVSAGLYGGEQVIVEGPADLAEGDRVKAR
jgi:RND family efflux transporter MFP subunit